MRQISVYVTHKGLRLSLSEWARRQGVNLQTACTRYRRGVRDFDKLFATKRISRRLIEYRGRKQSISPWAREIGLSRERLRQRLLKYPVAVALKKKSP